MSHKFQPGDHVHFYPNTIDRTIINKAKIVEKMPHYYNSTNTYYIVITVPEKTQLILHENKLTASWEKEE